MSASNDLENAILLLIFQNANYANVGDATGLRGSTVAGSLYLTLHTADPGEAGDQTTSEISYTGYVRKAVARDNTVFGISGNTVTFASDQSFVASSGGTGGVATHFGIGTASSGAGRLMFSGALSPTITVNNGVTPKIAAGTTVTAD